MESGSEKLKNEIEKVKEAHLNLRFDNVEKQLLEIKEILKESNILSKQEIESLKKRVTLLEEYRRNCPIATVKQEVIRYHNETSFIRGLFKNPWKGAVILGVFIIIITIFVIIFGPNKMFETLLKMKGL